MVYWIAILLLVFMLFSEVSSYIKAEKGEEESISELRLLGFGWVVVTYLISLTISLALTISLWVAVTTIFPYPTMGWLIATGMLVMSLLQDAYYITKSLVRIHGGNYTLYRSPSEVYVFNIAIYTIMLVGVLVTI